MTARRAWSRFAGTGAALAALVLAPASLSGQDDGLSAGVGGYVAGTLQGCDTDLRHLNHVSGWQVRWPRRLAREPVETESQRRAALARWAEAPALLEADVRALRRGLERGTAAPGPVVRRVLDQLDAWLAEPGPTSTLRAPGRRSGDAGFARRWNALLADSLLPAIRAHRKFLRETYLPGATGASPGLAGLPGGEACFLGAVERWTSLRPTPGELERWGRAALERFRERLAETAGVGAGEADGLLDRLRAGRIDAHGFSGPEEAVAHARSALDRARAAVPRWFGAGLPGPIEVERMPPSLEGSSPAGFYVPPAGDGGVARYVINTSRLEDRRLMSEAIAFHEGIPGHHLQAAMAESSGGYVAGFAEGWAVYAERLAAEMGLYGSRLDRTGLWAKRLWAASRLVVEPGLHLHGWSREEAIAFMLTNTALPRAEIEVEVDRYLALPGQSLSYMLGNLELRRLRRRAEERLGDAFDPRAFRRVVLRPGSRPLPEVAADVEAWIEDGG